MKKNSSIMLKCLAYLAVIGKRLMGFVLFILIAAYIVSYLPIMHDWGIIHILFTINAWLLQWVTPWIPAAYEEKYHLAPYVAIVIAILLHGIFKQIEMSLFSKVE